MLVLLKLNGVPSDTSVAPNGTSNEPPGVESDTKVPVRVATAKDPGPPPPPV